MLQQTRVATVVAYFARFLERFPDVGALARAPQAQVLRLWAGLGYYARARHAHDCARAVQRDHAGHFPRTARELAQLPGIGPSTAAAIAAFCFQERAAILDGNVKRVLARFDAIAGDPARAAVRATLEERARQLLPARAAAMPAYTQAIMDLGATVCTPRKPNCEVCPLASQCRALVQGRADELPERSPSSARPIRQAHLMALIHRGEVLLERRPPRGIWGGLLSLPQFETVAELRRNGVRLGVKGFDALAARKHAFTHFTLQFTPHVRRLAGARPGNLPEGARWVPLRSAPRAGVPSPVRRVLEEIGAVL
jgi:A/G-specific adenine glycosylase